jgi:hypothetical protein
LKHFKTLPFSVGQGLVRREVMVSIHLEVLLCPTHGKSENILRLFDVVLVPLDSFVRIFV